MRSSAAGSALAGPISAAMRRSLIDPGDGPRASAVAAAANRIANPAATVTVSRNRCSGSPGRLRRGPDQPVHPPQACRDQHDRAAEASQANRAVDQEPHDREVAAREQHERPDRENREQSSSHPNRGQLCIRLTPGRGVGPQRVRHRGQDDRKRRSSSLAYLPAGGDC